MLHKDLRERARSMGFASMAFAIEFAEIDPDRIISIVEASRSVPGGFEWSTVGPFSRYCNGSRWYRA